MNNIKRLKKSGKSLNKAEKKLIKARQKRIWIEKNPHVHLLNYLVYRTKYIIKHLIDPNEF